MTNSPIKKHLERAGVNALFGLLLTGCVSPSSQFLETAKQYNFKSELQQGTPYLHHLLLNSFAQQNHFGFEELHVYLDGDGTPFTHFNFPAEDPTARNHLILDLLAKDKKPAILLGRPCYYESQKNIECQPVLWTSERYSQKVITSLVFALQQWLKTKPATRLVFIGYSGGGALVTFLAQYFPQTSVIVTIAGNLDVQAWCEYHHYNPLQNSLNPIESSHIPFQVKQFHLAGEQDKNVLPLFIKNFSAEYLNSTFLSFKNFDHNCCWAEIWENFLESTLK
jgi:hypothetical protein